MNARIPLGPCMCGAMDCPNCGPAQGYAPHDDDALEGFIQSEIAVLRADPAAVTDALGSLSDGDYATADRLVFEALDGDLTTGFRPAQLQAIGEHLVMATLKALDRRVRAA